MAALYGTMRILLVEDDPQLGSTLQRALEHAGYLAEWVVTANEASYALNESDFDLMVLDWMLPQQSGVDFLVQCRRQKIDIPVIMLTAHIDIDQKITGLDAGADDYLTKPYELNELLARIRALLRRRTVKPSLIIEVAGLTLDPSKQELTCHDIVHILTKNELIIMETLMQNAGHYVPKGRLEECISYWDKPVTANAVEALISRLRKRLGKEIIQTLRGIGYKVAK